MSRSGFHEADDWDTDAILAFGRVQGQIKSAMRGRRGQTFLRMAARALDQMEDKRLAGGTFGVGDKGCLCLMSSIATETGRAHAFSRVNLDDGESVCESLAGAFNVASVLVRDLVWQNDENAPRNPADRWLYMRRAIANALKEDLPPPCPAPSGRV